MSGEGKEAGKELPGRRIVHQMVSQKSYRFAIGSAALKVGEKLLSQKAMIPATTGSSPINQVYMGVEHRH